MVVFSNKNSFCLHSQTNPFCIKTNLRENRLFAARRALDGEKSTQNVKIHAEKRTNLIDELTSWQEDKKTSWQKNELTSGWEDKLINRLYYKKTSWQENELTSGWEDKWMRRQVDEKTSGWEDKLISWQEISILTFSSEQVYIKIMYVTCISPYQRSYTQSVCSKQPASISTKLS